MNACASIRRVVCSALVVLSWPAALPAQDVLAAGVAMVNEGRFDEAIFTLDGVIRGYVGDPARKRELAQAYLYQGLAFLGLQQTELAKVSFREALKANPDLKVSPVQFSAQVVAAFGAARDQASVAARQPGAEGQKPASPTTASTAPSNKGGKLPLILLGGAAVAGGGIALASGGGKSTPPTPPPAPSNQAEFVSSNLVPGSTVSVSRNPSLLMTFQVSTRRDVSNGRLVVQIPHPAEDNTECASGILLGISLTAGQSQRFTVEVPISNWGRVCPRAPCALSRSVSNLSVHVDPTTSLHDLGFFTRVVLPLSYNFVP